MAGRTPLRSGRRPGGHGLLIALFALYLVLLAWIVLWKLEIPYIGAAAGLSRPLKLVPFVASGDAGASAPDEVLANVLFFIPFGIYLGMLAPTWRCWQALGVFVAASLLLETTQHLLSTGSFDTTDILTNTAGGMVGLGLLALGRRALGPRADRVATGIVVAGTALSLIAIAAFFALHLHYGPLPDFVVRHPSPSN